MTSPLRTLLLTFVILHSSFDILVAAPPPELTVLRQQYDKVFAERVTAVHEANVATLDAKFTTALDNAIASAKSAGDLPTVLAIQGDKKLLADKQPLPVDDDQTPEPLKKLRAIYRDQLAKLTEQKTANATALLTPYAAKLQALEATLTKNDRVDEAKEVMDYRVGLKADAPPAAPAMAATPASGAATMPSATATSRNTRIVAPAEERLVALAALELSGPGIGSVTAMYEGKEIKIKKPEDVPAGDIQITRISISHTKPPLKRYKGMDAIAGLQHLIAFSMDNFPAQDADMDAIGTFPALEEFYIPNPKSSAARFTGSKLHQLTAPEKLRIASFQNSPIGSAGVEALGRCVNLTTLNLAHAQIGDSDLRQLAPLTKLTTLDLRWTDTSMQGIRHLKGLSQLKSFGWSPDAKKGRADFAEIAAMFPQITELRLSERTGAKAEDYAAIAALPLLASVFLEGSAATKQALPGIATVPQLENLRGYWWDGVEDADLLPLQGCPALKKIDVDAAAKITASGLMHLAKIPKLQFLVLSRFTSLKDADVAAFKQARPDVQVTFKK